MTNLKIPSLRRQVQSLVCLSLLILNCACSQGESEKAKSEQAADNGPSFSRDIQPIFDTNCVTCHQEAGASGGLNLESGTAYQAIVSVKSGESQLEYVSPGKPEDSYLIRKLENTHVQAGGSGERMPLTGPLDQQSIAAIRDWVKAGAIEN